MPRCEGRSTEAGVTQPCPEKRSDASVRLSQGDLMLCPSCCESRFPSGKPAAVKDTGRTRSAKSAENGNPSIQIAELREVIANQNTIIKSLSDKLNYVLSYLEIENCVNGPVQLAGTSDSPSKTSTTLPAPHATYASITARLAADSTRHRTAAVLSKDDAVAAVYVDIAKKTQRESNIIVSGIQPSSNKTDAQLVYSLCSTEFDMQLDIVYVKRL